jgi:hypothetical protein
MRALRMLAGAAVLAAPTLAFLASFGGVLSWPAWAGIVVACTAAGTAMSYGRPAASSHDRTGRS